MNNKIFIFISFLIGGGIGSFITYKIINDKCNERANAEIESVKQVYKELSNKKLLTNDTNSIEKELIHKNSIVDIHVDETDKIKNYANMYKSNNDVKPEKKEIRDDSSGDPYIISPDEFNNSEYEATTLFYYKDNVLADDDYNMVGNIEDTVGYSALRRLDKYDQDCIYVRNDKLKTDYEILVDERNYNDVAPKRTVIHPEDLEDEY